MPDPGGETLVCNMSAQGSYDKNRSSLDCIGFVCSFAPIGFVCLASLEFACFAPLGLASFAPIGLPFFTPTGFVDSLL